MKEIVVVILVIYFYYSSQHGLASANNKSIEKNGPSKTDITENNGRTFYTEHRKPRMEGGIISKKHALPGARNRNRKMNRFRLGKAGDAHTVWRIAGGTKAAEGQFPYQASLWEHTHTFICGGSVLNAQWVITAAYCVFNRITKNMTVVTGTNELMAGGDTYLVADSIIHEGFAWYPNTYAIAMLKIRGKIVFNARVQPIPLETSHVRAGTNLKISGWGHASDRPKNSNDLMFLDTKAISNKECNKLLSTRDVVVEEPDLCTYTRRHRGACLGDFGGPVTHNGKLVGITIWSVDCAIGFPDISVRVSSFVDWIHNTMH